MSTVRWLRRAGICYLECDDRGWIDLAVMLRGELIPAREAVVRVLMPPAAAAIELDLEEARILLACPQRGWTSVAAIPQAAALARLIDRGLLLTSASDDAPPVPAGDADALEDWFGPAAAYHYASRWEGVVARADLPAEAAAAASTYALSAEAFARDVEQRGAPPSHRHARGDETRAVSLPHHGANDLDRLLARRETHRLFDPARPMSLAATAKLLYRSLATIAEAPMGGGQVAQRKYSPSGGGLHPVEAYVLAANVEQLDCGWYHYRAHQHRLAPLATFDRAGAQMRLVALTAGQTYFRDAALLAVLTLRFPRHHWKYPRHAKAYRVMLLDAGHVGQTFALAATDDGLGAFITAAINEIDLERELDLDGMGEGVVAVLGCGHPASDGAVLRLSAYVASPGLRG